MWWMTLFCGLIATIVTSYKVFDQNEAPIDLSEFPGEYKRKYSGGYPKCKNVKPNPVDVVISSSKHTYIYTCDDPGKHPMKCMCIVPINTNYIDYHAKDCKQHYAHPNGNCKAFTLCVGTISYLMSCGAGTVFNPSRKACDHPANVKCPSQNTKSFEPPCPVSMMQVGRFPDVKSNCKSYFECQFGIVRKKDCEDDLVFDTWTHHCTFPNSSFCGCRLNDPVEEHLLV